jgi:hypothetical protein
MNGGLIMRKHVAFLLVATSVNKIDLAPVKVLYENNK